MITHSCTVGIASIHIRETTGIKIVMESNKERTTLFIAVLLYISNSHYKVALVSPGLRYNKFSLNFVILITWQPYPYGETEIINTKSETDFPNNSYTLPPYVGEEWMIA